MYLKVINRYVFLANQPATYIIAGCCYKSESTCISGRIKRVLHLISEDQTGFMSFHYICDDVRILYDILYCPELQNIPGMFLRVDWQSSRSSFMVIYIHKIRRF